MTNSSDPDKPNLFVRVVVCDLDETTGAWGAGSLAFKMFHKFAGKAPPTDKFVHHYLECGGARPWLKYLLQTLQEWKRIGRIDEVAIFTAANNSNGWVTFLRECMELYAQTPGLFGRCFARPPRPVGIAGPNGEIRMWKDLSCFSPNPKSVVLIDDQPWAGDNGITMGVPVYNPDVCITGLMEWMKTAIPTHADQIESVFAADAVNNSPNTILANTILRDDNALYHVVTELRTIFPDPVEEAAPLGTEIDMRSRSPRRSRPRSPRPSRGRSRSPSP